MPFACIRELTMLLASWKRLGRVNMNLSWLSRRLPVFRDNSMVGFKSNVDETTISQIDAGPNNTADSLLQGRPFSLL